MSSRIDGTPPILNRARQRAMHTYERGRHRDTLRGAVEAAQIMLRAVPEVAPEYPWALFWAAWYYGDAANHAREDSAPDVAATMTQHATRALRRAAGAGIQELRVRAETSLALVCYQAGDYMAADSVIKGLFAADAAWLAQHPVFDWSAQSVRDGIQVALRASAARGEITL